MSNEYKEWKQDRAEEAWNDIIKIVEIFEEGYIQVGDNILIEDIRKILAEGGWFDNDIE